MSYKVSGKVPDPKFHKKSGKRLPPVKTTPSTNVFNRLTNPCKKIELNGSCQPKRIFAPISKLNSVNHSCHKNEKSITKTVFTLYSSDEDNKKTTTDSKAVSHITKSDLHNVDSSFEITDIHSNVPSRQGSLRSGRDAEYVKRICWACKLHMDIQDKNDAKHKRNPNINYTVHTCGKEKHLVHQSSLDADEMPPIMKWNIHQDTNMIDEWDLLNLELIRQKEKQRTMQKFKSLEVVNKVPAKDKLEILHIHSCDYPISPVLTEDEYTKSLLDSEEEDLAHMTGEPPYEISSGDDSEIVQKKKVLKSRKNLRKLAIKESSLCSSDEEELKIQTEPPTIEEHSDSEIADIVKKSVKDKPTLIHIESQSSIMSNGFMHEVNLGMIRNRSCSSPSPSPFDGSNTLSMVRRARLASTRAGFMGSLGSEDHIETFNSNKQKQLLE